MSPTAADWIADWFAERGTPVPRDGATLADIDYLETGLIDSVAMIELIADIEHAFRIRLSGQALRDPRFSTLSGLAAIIDEAAAR